MRPQVAPGYQIEKEMRVVLRFSAVNDTRADAGRSAASAVETGGGQRRTGS